MKNRLQIWIPLLGICAVLAMAASGPGFTQSYQLATTAFSRALLRAQDAAAARTELGITEGGGTGDGTGNWTASGTADSGLAGTATVGGLRFTSAAFALLTPTDATNFVLDASGPMYPEINASAAVSFLHCTNGPGVATVTIYPGTADRIISMSTNWFWASTNGFTLSGDIYTVTLSSNNAALLSIKKRSNGSDQTNVVAAFQITER